jgi:hypothetical protein
MRSFWARVSKPRIDQPEPWMVVATAVKCFWKSSNDPPV